MSKEPEVLSTMQAETEMTCGTRGMWGYVTAEMVAYEKQNQFFCIFCWHTRVRTSNSCLSNPVGDHSFQRAEVYGGSLIINLTHNVSFLGIQTPKILQNYGAALARSMVGRFIFLY